MSMLKVVLVTGISGSGKSVALRMLEDASYTCVDNLPVRFLTEFVANARDDGLERVAVAIDVRSPGELAELPDVVTALRAMGTSLRVVFLDAIDALDLKAIGPQFEYHPLFPERVNTEFVRVVNAADGLSDRERTRILRCGLRALSGDSLF